MANQPFDLPPAEEAGEILSPVPWRPVERRRFFSICAGLITGGVLGYASHPWLFGPRREQLTTFLDDQWRALNSPRRRPAPEPQTDDLHEDRALAGGRGSRNLPVTLDAHGLAYQDYLWNLKLRHIQPIELLRPHFKSRGLVRNELPPKTLWRNIAPALVVADILRHELGVPLLTISSAYRSPSYNNACPGAAPHSYHTRNMALDLVYDCAPGKVAEAAHALRKRGVFHGGIGRYPTFTHIDTRGKNADWGYAPKIARS